MTQQEHQARHIILHAALDELAADWAAHQPVARGSEKPKVYSNTSIMELIQWSYRQTKHPTGRGIHSAASEEEMA